MNKRSLETVITGNHPLAPFPHPLTGAGPPRSPPICHRHRHRNYKDEMNRRERRMLFPSKGTPPASVVHGRGGRTKQCPGEGELPGSAGCRPSGRMLGVVSSGMLSLLSACRVASERGGLSLWGSERPLRVLKYQIKCMLTVLCINWILIFRRIGDSQRNPISAY